MYQKLQATCTVSAAPFQDEGDLVIPGQATQLIKVGEEVKSLSVAIRIVVMGDKAKENVTRKICPGQRILVSGQVITDDPKSGNPMLYENEQGEVFTVVELATYSTPKVIGYYHEKEAVEDLLQVILVGNLGRDPEMRYTPGGQAVTSFSLAVNQVTGSGPNAKKSTTWWRLSAWERDAENIAKYMKAGNRMLVVAAPKLDPQTGSWRIWGTDCDRASFEATVQDSKFLTNKSESAPEDNTRPVTDDDATTIPF